ncbi:MAG: hypothetical protein H5T61_05595 [Thermoflexales bacterium]|nr:hypothetical protein [Thermoflexales bacterium]
METMIVEREKALSLVQELLAQLAPGEKVEVIRYDGTLILRRESSIDPQMLERLRRVSERYHDVFRRLAES